MIAQGRVSENLCTAELAHLSQGDSLYRGPAVHCCLGCMLPTGLENADPLLRQRGRETEQRTDIPNNRCSSAGMQELGSQLGLPGRRQLFPGKATLSPSSHHEPTRGSLPLEGPYLSHRLAGMPSCFFFFSFSLIIKFHITKMKKELCLWIIFLSCNFPNRKQKMPWRLW